MDTLHAVPLSNMVNLMQYSHISRRISIIMYTYTMPTMYKHIHIMHIHG